MKLPNSLTARSNRDDIEPGEEPWKMHRFLPAVIVLGWTSWIVFPLLKDVRAVVFLFWAPAGFIPWLERLAVPKEWHWPLAILLMILFLSLPWFSILAGSYRATTVCTLSCLALAMLNINGCKMQMRSASRFSGTLAPVHQAQRASVIQPRVGTTLGAHERIIATLWNPKGVPYLFTCALVPSPPKLDRNTIGLISSHFNGHPTN